MQPTRDILAYLKEGGKLTVNRAIMMFHTTELRKIVSRLRRKGHNIRANKMKDITSDGRSVTFNEYYYVCEQN